MKTTKLFRLAFLIVFLVMQQMGVMGQIFDFQNKASDKFSVANQNFTFKMKRINTLKYDIQVNNKTIKQNIEIPEFLKTSISNSNNLTSDKLIILPENHNQITLTKKIVNDYSTLKIASEDLNKISQFYQCLEKLVGSRMSTDNIISYKKLLFEQYMNSKSINDQTDALSILLNYSGQANDIIEATHIVNEKDNTKKNEIDTIEDKTKRLLSSNIINELACLY